jgi:hypothetical protein
MTAAWYSGRMETITCHVRDIDSADRRVLELIIGQRLQEDQNSILQVVPLGTSSAEAPPPQAPPAALPTWCHVYDGLSDEEVRQLEEVTLERADLTRHSGYGQFQ